MIGERSTDGYADIMQMRLRRLKKKKMMMMMRMMEMKKKMMKMMMKKKKKKKIMMKMRTKAHWEDLSRAVEKS